MKKCAVIKWKFFAAVFAALAMPCVQAGDRYYVVELFAGNSTASAQEKSLSKSWKELEQSVKDLRDLFR